VPRPSGQRDLELLLNRHFVAPSIDKSEWRSDLNRSAIFQVVDYAATIAAVVYLGRQVKKPTRFVGRLFAHMMNDSHSALTDWALSHLMIDQGAKVLDVGCGGGRTIEKMAQIAASVCGIDYAAGSIGESQSHNRRFIAEGKVHVERASVSQLPFTGEFFDVVTAIENPILLARSSE
jgi:SAM-dependent methyltransferase